MNLYKKWKFIENNAKVIDMQKVWNVSAMKLMYAQICIVSTFDFFRNTWQPIFGYLRSC